MDFDDPHDDGTEKTHRVADLDAVRTTECSAAISPIGHRPAPPESKMNMHELEMRTRNQNENNVTSKLICVQIMTFKIPKIKFQNFVKQLVFILFIEIIDFVFEPHEQEQDQETTQNHASPDEDVGPGTSFDKNRGEQDESDNDEEDGISQGHSACVSVSAIFGGEAETDE